MTSWRTVRILILLSSLGAQAFAEPPPAVDVERRKDVAKSYYEEGRKAYNLGSWEEAEADFKIAYKTWADPNFLFNTCQAQRQQQKWADAIATCKAYLRDTLDATNRETVEQRIREMEVQLYTSNEVREQPPIGVESPSRIDPAPAPSPSPTPLPSRPAPVPWWRDKWGWAVLGAGLTVSAVGVGLLVNAGSLDDEADAERDQSRVQDLRDQASSRRTMGVGLSIVGGAGVALGLVKLSLKW